MYFNFPAYGNLLLDEFFRHGGHFEMRNFHWPHELGQLPELVVIHATRYSERGRWQNRTFIPVHGQSGLLVPSQRRTIRCVGANMS